jgi:beta-glucuronidase
MPKRRTAFLIFLFLFSAFTCVFANTEDEKGAAFFYRAEKLRERKKFQAALKYYYKVITDFPKAKASSKGGDFKWAVAPEAISRIRKICALNPRWGIQLEGAFVDKEKVSPGKFVKTDFSKRMQGPFQVVRQRGKGKVKLVKYSGDFWRLLVDNKPFIVKGVHYTSTKVGESAHALNLRPWMTLDDNANSKNDGMFDSWVDVNKNNRQDPGEPPIGDAWLLKNMGANAIRVYHGVDHAGNYDPSDYDKPLMRILHRDYGIYFIMGDFLGAYTIGSQAHWDLGTDYTNLEQRERMKNVVRAMVMDHKDEPYVLMWLLGNENQHPHTRTNANENPESYARFVNEVAAMIHEIDPEHPVAIGNLYTSGLEELAKYAPEVDVYGANVYSGAYSMGSIWQSVKHHYDRPILFTEMGCDAYSNKKGVDEKGQAKYLFENWKDIELNLAGAPGEGNGIGGVVFEWMDEWWKTSKGNSWGDPDKHNTEGDFQGPFPDGWMHEEWLGIFGQGHGKHSPFLRQPRLVYATLKKLWKK